MGAVFQAEHVHLHRTVALKLLREEVIVHDEVVRRFDREAKALATLEHPNIVAVSDYGADGGTPFLVMEYLQGATLAHRGLAAEALDVDWVLDVVRQILSGLAYAHEKGVLHRDLKPANILLARQEDGTEQVKILDFGMAKILAAEEENTAMPTLTRDGTVLGTPSYMSPEQAASSPTDARSDVYSVGIILYELLAGRCPFVADKPMALLRAHLVDPVPDPSELRPGLWVSLELRQVLNTALSKHREDRYADATQMLDALNALPVPAARLESTDPPSAVAELSQAETVSARSSSDLPPPPARRGPRRRSTYALAGAGLLLLVGVSVGFVVVQGESDAQPEPTDRQVGAEAVASPVPALPPLPPGDPLAGAIPAELQGPLAKVRGGGTLDRDEARALRQYQSDHPDDPRPSLLLGRSFYASSWLSDSVARYQQAFEIDPESRRSAWMLEDLVAMAQTGSHAVVARGRIVEFYGPEAIPAVDRALAREGIDRRSRNRLLRLKRELTAADR